jgi:ABC-type uncharacterized transport system ATPase subunit
VTNSETDAPAPSSDASPALELRGIDKWFGPVHANNQVSFTVPRGTIHGIIGENGAGKSTLMSIAYGYYQADAGEILVNGTPVKITGTQNALSHGIGMVHQHFMLVEPFTVLENMVLGAESGPLLAPGLKRARAELARLERDYSLQVNPDAKIESLQVGLRQRVEILKALYRGANILILDEPTGVLTPQEADQLFYILRALRDQGKTIILITHKLREIMALTKNVTVMRQGSVAANVKTAETSREQLAELMVGRSVLLRVDKTPAIPGAKVLEVNDLSVSDDQGIQRVKRVSFDVRAGEILGIAGVTGNGQSELLEALAGIRPIESGAFRFKGNEVNATCMRDAQEMRQMGLGHVPEDRQRMGLVVSFLAKESSILGHHRDPKYTGRFLMQHKAIVDDVTEKMDRFDVRPSNPLLRTSSFSGGNQQKIVLVREMDQNPDLLLVGQPTRGVDIGAIEFIHKRLIAMRDQGKAVLLVSVELDEIMSLADRIIVMFEGNIVGQLTQDEADERKLGLMMAGEQLSTAA